MRFSMILEMVDRLSGPARRARAGARGLGDNIRQMGQRVRRAVSDVRSGERSLEHFARRARRLRQVALGRIFQAIGSSVRGLTRNLGSLIARLRLVERAGRAAGAGLRKLGGAGLGMLKNGILGGGAALAGAGGFALFDLFRTAGQFEQYQMSLEGIEGSAQAAKKAMAWVTEFAKVTPYELDEVMEAFVALKNFGLDPMDGSLRAMGDAASAMNKPIMAAIEMLTDASTGEFERLKEFGIKARKEGDRTTFHYIKNNKKMQRSVSGDELEIKRVLTEIFSDRFGGGMERQSKTMFGIISNLKGMWTEFLLLIANAGIFDFVKGRLQGLLDKVNEMSANGQLQRWAQEISDRMIKAWEWGEKFIESDWSSTIQNFKDIAEAVGFVADGILAIKRAKDALDGIDAAGDEALGRMQGNLTGPRSPNFPAGRPATKAPPRAPARLNQGFWPKQSSVDVGGTLKIDVSGAPGLAVRATPVATPGSKLPMEVRTGRTMRGAA
jgi:hypothetical protein